MSTPAFQYPATALHKPLYVFFKSVYFYQCRLTILVSNASINSYELKMRSIHLREVTVMAVLEMIRTICYSLSKSLQHAASCLHIVFIKILI